MKAIVDAEKCTGCGLCAETCPQVFEMTDGLAVAKPGPVPPTSENDCRNAAADCPVEAITVS